MVSWIATSHNHVSVHRGYMRGARTFSRVDEREVIIMLSHSSDAHGESDAARWWLLATLGRPAAHAARSATAAKSAYSASASSSCPPVSERTPASVAMLHTQWGICGVREILQPGRRMTDRMRCAGALPGHQRVNVLTGSWTPRVLLAWVSYDRCTPRDLSLTRRK
jgi:hypothetical protein